MAKGCICWVVALLPEAKPLIEKLEMKLLSRDTLHPIYNNETGTDWLVISGVGQLNAASGSATLYQSCPKANTAIWVNIGIAGGSIAGIGELFYINSIRKEHKTRTFYPFIFPNIKIKNVSLVTYDSPQKNYNQDYIFDMEAWAFYETIQKRVNREFIAVFKVLSDNSEASMKGLTKLNIFNLINDKLEFLESFRIKAQTLSGDEFRRQSNPEIFDQLINKFHFTFTQKQQLKSLIKRWNVLLPGKSLNSVMENKESAKAILGHIKEILDEIEIDWDEK